MTAPNHPDVLATIDGALAARDAGDVQQAMDLLQRALKLQPGHPLALEHCAKVALAADRPNIALSMAGAWSRAVPASAEARNVLAVASRLCGRNDESIAHLRESLSLDPDYVEARVNLGDALLDAGDAAEALVHYEHALRLEPHRASVHNNKGNAYRVLGRLTDALESYFQALAVDPRHARAHANVGRMLKDLGDTTGAIDAFRRSLALSPDRADVWSNLLVTLNGAGRVRADEAMAEVRAYGLHFAQVLAPMPPRVESAPRGRRLRVGYVSSHFRRHGLAAFFEPLLEAHDRAQFEVFCYDSDPRSEVGGSVGAASEHFVTVARVPDLHLAEHVQRDAIDVLIDLDGHGTDNRLPMFFLRPAPVQATWLGDLAPTGVPTIGWRITDAHVDPADAPLPAGLEVPWRLPRTMWCYRPPVDAPDVGALPSVAAGAITFGCLNDPSTVSATILELWIEILHSVPGSRLRLLAPADAGRATELSRLLDEVGIAPTRLELLPRPSTRERLALYARIDIALDTTPSAGRTTSCDALWMGVPLITLAGDRPAARAGASVLAQVGLSDLVAQDAARYVERAIALAGDRARLLQLRGELRPRMAASPLTDGAQFARDFETALRAMWMLRSIPAPSRGMG